MNLKIIGIIAFICGVNGAAQTNIKSGSAVSGASPAAVASPSTEDAAEDKTSTAPDVSDAEDEQLTTQIESSKSAASDVHDTGTYWAAPDFSKQDGAVGWSPTVFEVPPGFQRRVGFWIDVYTKYSTHQALLHDAHYLDLVYKVIDFNDIENDAALNYHQKEKAKKKRIKEEKKYIQATLLQVQALEDTPSRMNPEQLTLFKKFRFVFEKNKFKAAAQKNRLRMQLGQKDRFAMGIFFSGRYIREMERIFREEKVPMQLTRLPFVESSFNLYAYSKVGASGIWQFMRSTGRLFHLRIDAITDPRNDPLNATRAAAKLLRMNYQMLKSWPLALTAYNHGPKGVSNIVKTMKTDDINQIVWNTTRRRFGFASENFYAEFLAALEVESHAAKYFGKVQVSPPLVYEEIHLPRTMTFTELAMAMRGDTDDGFERARLYNPYFTRQVMSGRRKIPSDFLVRIPKNYKDRFFAQLDKIDPVKVKNQLALDAHSGLYKILPGDTLSSISRDFGVSTKQLIEANKLSSHGILRPGKSLVIPTLENR